MTTVNISAVLSGRPLHQCIHKSQAQATKQPRLKLMDRVTYRRRNRDGKAIGRLVRGFIDEMTQNTAIIFDTSTGELVACSQDRITLTKRS